MAGKSPIGVKYTPLPTAKLFHKSRADNRWNVGGLGSSKSRPLVEEAWMLGVENPGTRIAVIRKTFPSLRETTMRFFQECRPQELVQYENKTEHKERWYNGTTILFHSADSPESLNKLMSDEYGVIAVDESTDFSEEEIRKMNYRKRHQKGPLKSIYASNSGGQDFHYEWFYSGEDTLCRLSNTCSMFRQDWCKRPVQRMVTKTIEVEGIEEKQTFEMFVSCTMENTYLPRSYITDLLLLPDEEKKRYFYCSFDIFVGQIYSEWNDRIHQVDEFEIPDDWLKIRCLDHGTNHPTCVLWAAVNPEGFVFFYDEHYKAGWTPDEHAPIIHEKSGGSSWKGRSLCDPHIWDKTQVGKKDEGQVSRRHSVGELYRDKGLIFRKADNAWEAGKLQTKQYLKVNPNLRHPLTGELGSPMVFVVRGKCPNLVRQIKGLKYKPDSEESQNLEDDATDCKRYILMSLPKLVEKKLTVATKVTYRDVYNRVDNIESDGFRMGYTRRGGFGI